MRYFSFLLLLFFQLSLSAQNTLPKKVAKNIQARIDNNHSPSIVVGIIDKKGPQYYFFGTTTIDGEPVDEHTIYEIGSISKTFTGILLAQMVKEGKVALADPVQKYLPESVKMPKWEGQEITLAQLSDHTSSLPRMPANLSPKDNANPFADYTVEDLYAFLNAYELPREIGSEFEYSNLAQGLLGHVLARVQAKSYEDLVVEMIAKPLGMNETRITFDQQMQKHLAPGHSMGRPVSNWDIPTLAGAGAIRSSLHDMLLFLEANLGLKKTALYPAMQFAHQGRHDKAGNSQVGLAWVTSKGSNGDVIWHNGGTGGYRTFAGFVKETGKGVVVLANSDMSTDDIGFYLLNPQLKLMEAKKSMTTKINNVILDRGPDEAWTNYLTIKETDLDSYELNENEINALGYKFLASGAIEAAITVFKVNVDAFPVSSNVYDSYGEALMKDGQTEAAIENYQRSFELNPANTNAVKILTQLGAKPKLKEVVVKESVLASYAGTYQIQLGFNIVITQKGKQLFGQATGQPKFELFPKTETGFYVKIVDAQIEFTVEKGTVKSLTLFQGGQKIPGKKIK